MNLINQLQEEFEPYPCSMGIVIGYDQGNYSIQLSDGRVAGIVANDEPSKDNVEADIAASL
jgi:hypothetical protein